MTITLHGIKNCDSVKKARKWLDAENIDYEFRDFRQVAPSATEIKGWLQHYDWQQVLNKRSTSWKSLSQSERDGVTDATTAIGVIVANPTLIKRPLLTDGKDAWVGFSDAKYQQIFDQQ